METLFKIRSTNDIPNNPNPPQTIPKSFFSTISKEDLAHYFAPYNLAISTISYQILRENGNLLSKNNHWELYKYEGYTYFYRNDKFDSLLIQDMVKVSDKTLSFIVLTILLNSTFLLFYLFLLKKLSPLKKLKNNITQFSKGDLSIDTSTEGKDEISAVSNEFNKAIIEIRTLTESRNLFLRNIMHELKTPITKGKLIRKLLKNEQHSDLLQTIFERLEYLLHEFAKIEQLTSNNIHLDKQEYRVIDIIDQAIDTLMVSKDNIQISLQHTLCLTVDFYLFSIVFKNLIDNGLKYSDAEVLITGDKNHFCIITQGKKLEKNFEEYLQPFNRKYETTSQSLGLGLYIVAKILKLHQMKLSYSYENNTNIFCISSCYKRFT